MNFIVKVFYVNVALIFVCAQNDGRYRPLSSISTTKPVVGDGRYRPSNDGRYNPVSDGKYRPSNDGKYVHVGDKDRGLYSGSGGEYTGGGGQYTGSVSSGGKYTGTGGEYTGGFGQYTGGEGIGRTTPRKEISVPDIDRRFGETLQTTPKSKPRTLPQNDGGKDGWKIFRDEKTEDADGYHYLYETENGILAEESGRIEKLSPNEEGLRSKGFYQYTGDDGVLYRVDYVADSNGFVPQGDHIPKTPPAIQKLLDYLATQS